MWQLLNENSNVMAIISNEKKVCNELLLISMYY